MNLRQLRYFLAAADQQSLSAAARAMNVSQPALGQQVRELEDEVGVALLERHARGVRLTEAGRLLKDRAVRIVAEFEDARAVLAPFRKAVVREITLGSPPTPGRLLLPELMPAARKRSNLKITSYLDLSDALVALVQADELDVALSYDAEHVHASVPLFQEDMYLIGPPDIVRSADGPIAFGELAACRLVLDRRSRGMRKLIDDLASRNNVRLDVSFDVESIDLKREFMMHDGCCTITFYGSYLDDIDNGELGARHIVKPTIPRILSLIYRRGLDADIRGLVETLIRPIVGNRIEEGRVAWHALEAVT